MIRIPITFLYNMHHFIYPSQDTFITNTLNFDSLNFGLDETLRVGTQTTTTKVQLPTTSYTYPSNSFALALCVENFSGSLVTASISGSAQDVWGYVFDTSIDPVAFTVDYFSGSFVGSANGWINGTPYSQSAISASVNGFSGSIVIFSLASVQSGSGYINGWISGSLTTTFLGIFNGSIDGFTGQILVGNISGQSTKNVPHTEIINKTDVNRALVQFDIDAISQSIANGDIPTSSLGFNLKLNVAREFNLPIKYQVFAFPIAESWVMGDGYISDNGSTQGASWDYRDYQNGTLWAVTGSSYIQSVSATQSFDYQVGDINMDITPIVNYWLSGSPNYGLVLISSDEFQPTGSGMCLRFFSKDTNTIYEPILDVGWSDALYITGSVGTASANISTVQGGFSGSIASGSGAYISGSLYGCFSGMGNIFQSSSLSSSYSASYDATGSFIETITSSVSQSFASGFIVATGTCGLITSMSIFGNFSGSVTQSIITVYSTCSSCRPDFHSGTGDTYDYDRDLPFFPWAGDDGAYNSYFSSEAFTVLDGQFPSQYGGTPNIPSWIQAGLAYLDQPIQQGNLDVYGWNHQFNTFNQYDWTSDHVYQQEFGPGFTPFYNKGCSNCGPYQFTGSILMGTFIDGNFSGSTFTSSLINGYILGSGYLMGSWNESMIDGTLITSSFPMKPMFPVAVYAYFYGPYVSGDALGSVTNFPSGSIFGLNSYGIFQGVFVDGPLAGLNIYAPFSGSILSSSYSYTSSLNLTSSVLSPVDLTKPFVTVVQNIPTTVNAGDVIRVNVFGRPQFPLKNFNRQTQFTQFLIPQYLPSSSYYAIKDNETEQIILDFDQYTQLSCDPYGNYFNLDTTSFPQERYFKILIRVIENGNTYTFDKGNIFKIIR